MKPHTCHGVIVSSFDPRCPACIEKDEKKVAAKRSNCVICTSVLPCQSYTQAFFVGAMAIVQKCKQAGVTPEVVWDRAVETLCPKHREEYLAPTRST